MVSKYEGVVVQLNEDPSSTGQMLKVVGVGVGSGTSITLGVLTQSGYLVPAFPVRSTGPVVPQSEVTRQRGRCLWRFHRLHEGPISGEVL